MAKKKEPTMDMLAKELEDCFARWHAIHTKGCKDPFWSDGMNLNLVRNHILYYKEKIEELLTLEPKPPIYYKPTPMEAPDDFMARPRSSLLYKRKEGLQMETKNLTITFDEDKLEALNFYLTEKGSAVERELTDCLGDLYRKNVPTPTRKFIERNLPTEERSVETATEEPCALDQAQAKKAERTAQREKRQAEKAQKPEAAPAPNEQETNTQPQLEQTM